MGRIARVVVPGCWHHVTQRGNHQQTVFFSDADRRFYLRCLREYSIEFGMQVGGYCLMNNHVHLLVIPESAKSLARAVGRTHNDYARWLNFTRGGIGHVWQNRFYSCPLDEAHPWFAIRYAELNPVHAGLVKHAEEWRWSSARAHITGQDPTGLIDFADRQKRWSPDDWKCALEMGIQRAAWIERLREATRTGRPLGGDGFIQEVEAELKRALQPKKRGPKTRRASLSGQMNFEVV
jgi:putative transposase